MAEEKTSVVVPVYRGMPSVELTEDEKALVDAESKATHNPANKLEGPAKGPISISLESLDIDLQHNQSYGMVQTSTGCISNPGGPSC